MRNLRPLACALVLYALPAAAQTGGAPLGEPVPALQLDKDKAWQFKLGGNVGAASVTDPDTGQTRIYNTIALQPEAAFGKLGLGLDLYVYFDSDGKARKQDWQKAKDLVSKIWYVRWGAKGDPLFARLGGLPDVTLGHGFIMGGYNNRLRYPDVRKVGGQLDFDLGWGGAETMVGDVQYASLLGARGYVRPLHGSEMPVLKDLAFGVSGVTDRNPDNDKSTTNDQVSVYGADFDLPLLKNDWFSTKLYGDAAMMRLGKRYTDAGSKDNGKGFAAGLGGKLLFFDYRAEMRSADDNFIPDFFDGYYEVDRSTAGVLKADRIPGTEHPRRQGPFAQLFADILGKVKVGGTYENLNYDPFGLYPRVSGELRVDPSLLLNKFEFASLYERRNCDKMKDLGRTRNSDSILSTEIAYRPNESLRLVAVFRQTYDQNGVPVRTTQLRSDVRF